MVITFALCLPRDEASVPVIRRLCKNALEDLGVESGCVSDIELAVTEACTNVLKHAHGPEDDYEVKIEIDDSVCTIRVIDTGTGFDHAAKGREEALAGAENGRGIQLIRALVDNVRFISRPEDGTIVLLEKSLELKDGSILERLARATN